MIFEKKDRRVWLYLFSAVVAGVLLSKLIGYLIENAGGMTTIGIPIHLVTNPGEIGDRISGYFTEFGTLLGAQDLGAQESLFFFCFYQIALWVWRIVYAVVLCYCTVRFRRLTKLDQILYLISLANILCCVFTDVVIVYRYIVPAYIFGTALMLKNAAGFLLFCRHKKRTLFRGGCCAAMIMISIIIGVRAWTISGMTEYGALQKNVMDTIKERDYGAGYGGFWQASLISSFSEYEIPIYPIVVDDDSMRPYHELIKNSWYEESDKHFVIAQKGHDDGFINKEALVKRLGEPDDQFAMGDYQVYFWEKDISSYLS